MMRSMGLSMAIANALDWEHIKVDAKVPLKELIAWTYAQNLGLGRDYQFAGQSQRHWHVSFKSKDSAMLFKLTFGGK